MRSVAVAVACLSGALLCARATGTLPVILAFLIQSPAVASMGGHPR